MHIAVMLRELVDAVLIQPDGVYMDATFGRGGHSRALLQRLGPKGRLIAIDQDPAAQAAMDDVLASDARFSLHHQSFADIAALAEQLGVSGQVSGIMADLGVSSPQLDQAERGFSFSQDGPLDMRMNPTVGESAAEWLASVSERELADVLYRFGDERYSRRIAGAIVRERKQQAIVRTVALAEIIKKAHPRWPKHHHPATKSFQAIRIYINQELAALEALLEGSLNACAVGGHLAILSFHSLEDRLVKQCFKKQAYDPVLASLPLTESDLARQEPHWRGVMMKKADDNEIEHNLRARSARLRVAEKKGV